MVLKASLHGFRRFSIPLVAVVLGVIFAGCVGDDEGIDELGYIDGAADTIYGEAIPTTNETLEIGGGYDLLFDRTTPSPCVRRVDGQAPEVMVTSPHVEIVVDTVSTRDDLARSLGVDMGLHGAYGPVSGSASFKLLDEYSRSNRSVSFLLQVKEGYVARTRNRSNVELTERAQELLATDLNRFVAECGTDYIDGIRFGAELFVMITFTAESEQDTNEIKTAIEMAARIPAVEAGGELSTTMSENATRQGVTTTIRAVANGFDLIETSTADGQCADIQGENGESLLATLVSEGVTPGLFNHIDCIKDLMHQSVALDRCRDSGDGSCDGAPSPGYHAVGLRHSGRTGVILGRYSATQGAQDPAAFNYINTQRQQVELFVRDINRIRLRTRNVYLDDLRPFLEAPAEERPLYNVISPENVVRTMRELVDVVESWDTLFHPADEQRWGTVDRDLTGLIEACWETAALNLDHLCMTGVERADSLPECQNALAELERYENTSRISRLDAIVLPEPVMFDDIVSLGSSAVVSCSEIAVGYRLPTRSEVQLLDLLVLDGPVPWSPDAPSEVWYADTADCGDNLWDVNPTYHATEQGGEFLCVSRTTSRAAICVPSSGPVPAL